MPGIFQPNADEVFQSERLSARRWHPMFASSALEIYRDPVVTEFIPGAAEATTAGMRQRIESIMIRNRKWPDHFGSWPVFEKSTQCLAGTLIMKPLPLVDGPDSEEVEVGWHLRRECWGRGYATEGGQRLVKLALEEIGLERVIAVIDPANVRSLAVAKRVGMKHLGQTQQYYDGKTLELFQMTTAAPIARPGS